MQEKALYFIEDFVDDSKRAPLIIKRTPGVLERYDFKNERFVVDYEMSRIYTGSLPVNDISEEDAFKAIAKYKKRFYS